MVRYKADNALSPAISKAQHLKLSSTSPTVAALFFFLDSIIFIIVLVILITILWKCIKAETLQNLLKFTCRFLGEDYCSGYLGAINHFDYWTLKKATNNLHLNNQLGRGGFGPVYLGVLDDGTMIVVKQLSLGKSQQGESEFLTEVRMITSVQLKNLVRLVGCCSQGAQRLLVYECMKNRSLDGVLYEQEMGKVSSTGRLGFISFSA